MRCHEGTVQSPRPQVGVLSHHAPSPHVLRSLREGGQVVTGTSLNPGDDAERREFPPLRREIQWQPGYDYRNNPEKRQFGCHGMNIRWLLIGPLGAVQFLIYSSWLPSWVESGPWGNTIDTHDDRVFGPMGADLGHHWSTPTYEDEGCQKCDILPGGECFYDGSGMAADDLLGVLLTEGHEAVWCRMESEYHRLAGGS